MDCLNVNNLSKILVCGADDIVFTLYLCLYLFVLLHLSYLLQLFKNYLKLRTTNFI